MNLIKSAKGKSKDSREYRSATDLSSEIDKLKKGNTIKAIEPSTGSKWEITHNGYYAASGDPKFLLIVDDEYIANDISKKSLDFMIKKRGLTKVKDN